MAFKREEETEKYIIEKISMFTVTDLLTLMTL